MMDTQTNRSADDVDKVAGMYIDGTGVDIRDDGGTASSEHIDAIARQEQQADIAKQTRVRSTIEFPYSDLEDSITLTQTVFQNGGLECSIDQLAHWAGHSNTKSGTFRVRLSASKTFGLIDQDRDVIRLTSLGERISDPAQNEFARVDAFLSVPLYLALYERFKGRQLPPTNAALENTMVQMGVSDKQKDRARQVFYRSADQAGVMPPSRDKLVLPRGATQPRRNEGDDSGGDNAHPLEPPVRSAVPVRSDSLVNQVGVVPSPARQHTLLLGLFEALPPPSTAWSEEERSNWLSLAGFAFKVVYKAE